MLSVFVEETIYCSTYDFFVLVAFRVIEMVLVFTYKTQIMHVIFNCIICKVFCIFIYIYIFIDKIECPTYNVGASKLHYVDCLQRRCPVNNYRSNEINVGISYGLLDFLCLTKVIFSVFEFIFPMLLNLLRYGVLHNIIMLCLFLSF